MNLQSEKYRKATVAFSVFGFATLVATQPGCDRGPSPEAVINAAKKRKIEVVEVAKGNIEDVIEVPVSIEGYERTSLVSKMEAYVGEVKVDIGQEVKKGDLLAILEAPEILAERERRLKMLTMNEKAWEGAEADMATASAEVDQAKARLDEQEAMLKLRESELSRVKGLVNSRVIIKERLTEAQYALESVLATVTRINADVAATEAGVKGKAAQVESALAEVEVSRADLNKVLAEVNYLEIRAPFDGLITERLVHPGAFVLPAGNGGSPLLTIESVEKMRAVMFIPITEAARIDVADQVVIHSLVGHPAGLTIPSAPNSAPLTLSRFANSLNLGSRMMRVEVDLENPIDSKTGKRLLKPGGYGKASLTLQRNTDIDLVPSDGIVEGDSGTRVVAVTAENTAEFIPVKVEISSGERSGVMPIKGTLTGRRVIATGAAKFTDGEDLSGDTITNSAK